MRTPRYATRTPHHDFTADASPRWHQHLVQSQYPNTMKITPPDKETRLVIGILLLLGSFLLAVTGAGLTWGITGACFAGAIALGVYAVGFFGSTAD